jgi:hypothetical protein
MSRPHAEHLSDCAGFVDPPALPDHTRTGISPEFTVSTAAATSAETAAHADAIAACTRCGPSPGLSPVIAPTATATAAAASDSAADGQYHFDKCKPAPICFI